MEFEFDINDILPNSISSFDRNLQLHRNAGDSTLQKQLTAVIDTIGTASAKAQGLGGAITTAYKLKYSDHHLYIMKESHANSNKGSVVGILKVGRKVLFVLDHHSNQIEMKPMCVLDFYVHESCQRRGHGKQLFQHMLNCERIEAQHLAIDRPSKKFTSFLMKHYRLRATIHQVNNFVIFEGFFKNQPDSSYPRKRSSNKPPLPPMTAGSRGGHRNTSDAALGGHRTPSRLALRGHSESTKPIERAVLNNIRPRSGSLPSSRASPSLNGSQEDLDLTARGLSYSRHHRSATPPSKPGSGTSMSAVSPITGDVTSVTNSPPVATLARNQSWEDSLARKRLPSRERNSSPEGRPPSGGVTRTRTDHIVDTLFNGIAAHVQTTNTTMQRVPSASRPMTTHPTDAANNCPTAATNTDPTAATNPSQPDHDIQSPGSRHLTEEGNYCMTSYTPPRGMPSSWNVLGVLPSPPAYDTGQSGALYRNSSYRTNRFF